MCIDDYRVSNANWIKVKVDLFIMLAPEHGVRMLCPNSGYCIDGW